MNIRKRLKRYKLSLSIKNCYSIRLNMLDNQKSLYKVIMNCHPDSDEEINKFKEIIAAYDDTAKHLRQSIECKAKWYY